MGSHRLLLCAVVFSLASAQSFDDPWLQDPILVSLWQLTRAINKFGVDLFRDLTATEKGNVLVCPYPLSSVLGILYSGSGGETEQELHDVLGYADFNLTIYEASQTFYMLATDYMKSSNPKFYLFDSPSTILVNRKDGLMPTFQKVVEVLYQTPITVVDFIESAEELVLSVNDWVADRTRNKIRHIIESVDPFSDIVVLSAVFFNGTWMHKFPHRDTHPGVFYNYGDLTEPTSVQMMRMTEILNFYRDEHYSVLELPFKSWNVSMLIILPNAIDGVGELLSESTPDLLDDLIWKMTPTRVEVALPKFKIMHTVDLRDNLARMGAESLFRPDKVDLCKMIRRDSITFEEVRHKSVMSVNENGVNTAASSAIVNFKPYLFVERLPYFNVDHPFLVVIYERRIKMILQGARVVKL